MINNTLKNQVYYNQYWTSLEKIQTGEISWGIEEKT